jgi:hypothetical protein
MEQLFWFVDDCCTPLDCEYRLIGPGGIYWPGLTGIEVPRPDISPDDMGDDWRLLPPEPASRTGGTMF